MSPIEPGVPFVVGDDAEPVPVPEPVEPVMPHVVEGEIVNDTGEPVEGQPVPGEVVEVVEPEPEPERE